MHGITNINFFLWLSNSPRGNSEFGTKMHVVLFGSPPPKKNYKHFGPYAALPSLTEIRHSANWTRTFQYRCSTYFILNVFCVVHCENNCVMLTNVHKRYVWDRILQFFFQILNVKLTHTPSVKLSDFTVWSHTWWKNWVNCAVLTGNSAVLRTVLFQSSFTQRTVQFTQGIPQFPQFSCRHHDGIISRHILF
jgi:hypothetical protein